MAKEQRMAKGGPKAVGAKKAKGTPGAAARKPGPSKRAGAPACPICGSANLDIRRADSPAKMAGKVLAGIVVPLILEPHDRISCRSCGWRSEATY